MDSQYNIQLIDKYNAYNNNNNNNSKVSTLSVQLVWLLTWFVMLKCN